jgi:hypothetical protein
LRTDTKSLELCPVYQCVHPTCTKKSKWWIITWQCICPMEPLDFGLMIQPKCWHLGLTLRSQLKRFWLGQRCNISAADFATPERCNVKITTFGTLYYGLCHTFEITRNVTEGDYFYIKFHSSTVGLRSGKPRVTFTPEALRYVWQPLFGIKAPMKSF